MSILELLPIILYAMTIIIVLLIGADKDFPKPLTITFISILALAFIVFSVVTVVNDGLPQFWINHTTNMTGNQVWFDLIFAVAVAFYLIAPRAKAVGMPLFPWALAVILTANVALLPMLARLIWLEKQV
ncbi:MAG: hypothetical protein AAFU71_06965 [Cyanobacteria bacterium J06632_22]